MSNAIEREIGSSGVYDSPEKLSGSEEQTPEPALLVLNPLELANIAVNSLGAMQKVPEFASLLALIATGRPKRIMEIGFGNGGSSWAFSKLDTLEELIIINLPNGPWGGSDDEKMLEAIVGNTKAKVTYISGNSQNLETFEAVNKLVEECSVDILFIDGDHSKHGCLADYDRYRQFVVSGGLVVFHDICEHAPETGCEVKKVWDKLKENLPEENYVEFISEPTNWGGIGVIKE